MLTPLIPSLTPAAPNGTYLVTLLQAELQYTNMTAHQRFCDIRTNGQTVLASVDLLQVAPPFTVVNITFFVEVTVGVLSFEMEAGRGLARLGAVLIEQVYFPSTGSWANGSSVGINGTAMSSNSNSSSTAITSGVSNQDLLKICE
jgi:hypothetical protein